MAPRRFFVGGLSTPLLLAVALVTTGLAVTLLPKGASTSALRGRVTPGPGDASAVDLGSMTPDEAADRLFRRVSGALVSQQMNEVRQFLPMALGAYGRIEGLSPRQSFQLSFLQRAAEQFVDALATAEEGLERFPEDPLLLGMASESALSLGDTAMAFTYARRLLDGLERGDVRDHISGADHEWLERLRARAGALTSEEGSGSL
ncbi:MAG: hypothetical protein OEO23_13030 [Gemmatimonadota bacterium]|nr:hypothetical protein [Gemmatimonadota bacterium]